MVGVNKYTVEEDTEPEILTVDEDVQERQRDKLATVKAERDDAAVEAALDDLRQVVTDGGNVMPIIIDAVKASRRWATMMVSSMAEYGSYQETASVA